MSLPPLVEPAGELSREEWARYARHLSLPGIELEGQRRLRSARVLVIGAGGLGSPVLSYLTAAGIGRITVVDDDVVSASNLQRQVLHRTADVGRKKVSSAQESLAGLNSSVRVEVVDTRLSAETEQQRIQLMELVESHHLVVDGADNFTTRFLANDACVLVGRPLVWASILRFDAQLSVFWAEHGPCYRCLVGGPPAPGSVPSCVEGGVLGALCGVIGSLQASEAIKLITGVGEPLVGQVLVHDALRARFDRIELRSDPGCPVCGLRPVIQDLADSWSSLRPEAIPDPQQLASEGAPMNDATDRGRSELPAEIEVEELQELLAQRARGERDFLLLDVREPFEREISQIPGSVLVPPAYFTSEGPDLGGHDQVICYCRSGVRSARARDFLVSKGIPAVNVIGGVLAWAQRIDPTQPQY